MKIKTLRTELVIRDDDKVARLVNSVIELSRQNRRLALERSIFAVAFACALVVLACAVFMNAR